MTRFSPTLATQDEPSLGEVLDFLRIIWAVDHGLQRASKQMKRDLGVTGPQRLVLRIVGRFPGIPAGRLARLLHVDPSTLTGILARLERQQLISRRSDPRDRRRSLLGLTVKGRRFDVATEGTIEARVAQAFSGIPLEQLSAAREVLSVLAAALAHPPMVKSAPRSST